MKKILVVVDYYLPGHKAGGQTRSVANLIEWLGDEFQFNVLTSDRDLGDSHSYKTVQRGVWQTVGKAQVLYLSPSQKNIYVWRHLLKTLEYDLIYLNSFFSRLTVITLLLRRAKLIPNKPILLAPQGEISPGALTLKRYKKRPFIILAKLAHLYQGLIWQASTLAEQKDILSFFNHDVVKDDSLIKVASNLPPRLPNEESKLSPRRAKQRGSAHVVFLSRISRKKNLDTALKLLAQQAHGQVQFDIYGPPEDQIYWQECQTLISRLPKHIQVEYKGTFAEGLVLEIFSQYHLLLLPTRGENFGYVILESLYAGCPVLISDQTPWRNLTEIKAGWDLSLAEPKKFHAALDDLISMDDRRFQEWSQAAREYALKFVNDPAFVEANRKLFMEALASRS